MPRNVSARIIRPAPISNRISWLVNWDRRRLTPPCRSLGEGRSNSYAYFAELNRIRWTGAWASSHLNAAFFDVCFRDRWISRLPLD